MPNVVRYVRRRRERHAEALSATVRETPPVDPRRRPARRVVQCGCRAGALSDHRNPDRLHDASWRHVDHDVSASMAAVLGRLPDGPGDAAHAIMTRTSRGARTALWSTHDQEWRSPAQVVSQWRDAGAVDPRVLRYTTRGAWWATLAASGVTLLITREYEHLVVAMRADRDGPALSYMPMPHPSGIAYDRARATVYVASTRNPNQIYDLMAVNAVQPRRDCRSASLPRRPLVPARWRFFHGCLDIHDLAMIGRTLYATAVGQNTVASVVADGRFEPAWWPRCIDTSAGPIIDRNLIQLNSIAAGRDLNGSFFFAAPAAIRVRPPRAPPPSLPP